MVKFLGIFLIVVIKNFFFLIVMSDILFMVEKDLIYDILFCMRIIYVIL